MQKYVTQYIVNNNIQEGEVMIANLIFATAKNKMMSTHKKPYLIIFFSQFQALEVMKRREIGQRTRNKKKIRAKNNAFLSES